MNNDPSKQRWFLNEGVVSPKGIIASHQPYIVCDFRYLCHEDSGQYRTAVKKEIDRAGKINYFRVDDGREKVLSDDKEIKRVEILLSDDNQTVRASGKPVRYSQPGAVLTTKQIFEGPGEHFLTLIKIVFEDRYYAHGFSPRYPLGENVDPKEWNLLQIWKFLVN